MSAPYCSGVGALRCAAFAAKGDGPGAPHCDGCTRLTLAIDALLMIYQRISTGQRASHTAGEALVALNILKPTRNDDEGSFA